MVECMFLYRKTLQFSEMFLQALLTHLPENAYLLVVALLMNKDSAYLKRTQ
jgi:hypothetical protein